MKFNSWIEETSSQLSIDFYKDLANYHAINAGPYRKTLQRLIKEDRLRELCEFEVDYEREGLTPFMIRNARQCAAFFQKLEFLDLGIDKRQVALDTYFDADQNVCRETNESFRAWAAGTFMFPQEVDRVFSDASRFIALVLGPVPKLNKLKYRHGPGATTLTKKREATARSKFRSMLSCSEGFLPHLRVLAETPGLLDEYCGFNDKEPGCLTASGDFSWLPGREVATVCLDEGISSIEVYNRSLIDVFIEDERLAFVLKNYKTDRTVSTPPPLNVYGQLAVGDHLMRRLEKFGLDLKDQSLNQALARIGSLTGELATLDLKSASDTLATELVYHLLPVDWAVFLDGFRSAHCLTPRGRVKLEKFAAMGNGFTFPLESLIFWALARAVCDNVNANYSLFLDRNDVQSPIAQSSYGDDGRLAWFNPVTGEDLRAVPSCTVYGDDIIVPVVAVPLMKRVLCSAGFLVNSKKSFTSGPFRESCGADFYLGGNVRPFYAKKLVSAEQLYLIHNYYKRAGDEDAVSFVLDKIPEELRLYGPDGKGDGHLVTYGDPSTYSRRVRENGYSGFYYESYVRTARKQSLPSDPLDLQYALYEVSRRYREPVISRETISSNPFLAKWAVLPYEFIDIKSWGKKSEFPGTPKVDLPDTDGCKRTRVYYMATSWSTLV